MDAFIYLLFLLPVGVSILLLFLPDRLARMMVWSSAALLTALSVYVYLQLDGPLALSVSPLWNKAVVTADFLLLLYFGYVAIRKRSWLVGLLTICQTVLLLWILQRQPDTHAPQFLIDRLSGFMFLLINGISGIIAIYSLRYIGEENCSPFRKRFFLSVIFWFIAAMNLVVSADNLEYFFLFFELTTLASFLFIGFRKDAVSEKNALTALWMNQVGGLAILAALFYLLYNGYGEPTFSLLLTLAPGKSLLLPLALLSIAALIKGAQMPFSRWLLGAMVAPTPVSALLHSSTMVKIAPFILLRLSPALKDTPVAMVIIGLTAFVFVASAVAALSQDNFKRILAHSTISLLALMMLMAAVATPVTLIASLILLLFHGISKCMLFLNAGVLERVFHVKQTSDMDRLGETGPFTSLVMTIGFLSLLLPPFGAFIGKWISIETLGTLTAGARIAGALLMLAVAGGGAVLALLYFKVMGVLIARSGEQDRLRWEKTGPVYQVTMYLLLGILLLSVFTLPLLLHHFFAPVAAHTLGTAAVMHTEGWNLWIGDMRLPLLPMLIAFFLLPATLVGAMLLRFRRVDRVSEYMCGEKLNYSFSSFYFSTDRAVPYFQAVGLLFFAALLLVALL